MVRADVTSGRLVLRARVFDADEQIQRPIEVAIHFHEECAGEARWVFVFADAYPEGEIP